MRGILNGMVANAFRTKATLDTLANVILQCKSAAWSWPSPTGINTRPY